MYPEFIAIYVMLAIVILLLGVAVFLLIKLMKKGGSEPFDPYNQMQQMSNRFYGQNYQEPYRQVGNVVFCKQCATQFDSSQAYCPNCGARR